MSSAAAAAESHRNLIVENVRVQLDDEDEVCDLIKVTLFAGSPVATLC